jgi:hypothetical protein
LAEDDRLAFWGFHVEAAYGADEVNDSPRG